MKVDIKKSTRSNKRYMAIFGDDSGNKSTTHFGYADKNKTGDTFIDHNDDNKKKAWIARHKVRGNFTDYKSASSLAKHILWEEKKVTDAIRKYKQKFNLL